MPAEPLTASTRTPRYRSVFLKIDAFAPVVAITLGIALVLGMFAIVQASNAAWWSAPVLLGILLLLLLAFAWRGQPLSRPVVDSAQNDEQAVQDSPLFKRPGLKLDLSALPKEVWKDLELVPVPAGEFLMGSPDGTGSEQEHPQHRVTFSDYYLAAYPVTRQLYRSVVGKEPEAFRGVERQRHPVTDVSWDDAVAFCNALSLRLGLEPFYRGEPWVCDNTRSGFRLPTEVEWEYAIRASTSTPWYWGDDKDKANDYAWYSANAKERTHPVGEKQPNPWGLYDMAGNVWEWVQDPWHDNYDGAPTDGLAWEGPSDDAGDRRVLRGGSWDSDPDLLRSASRGWVPPGYRSDSFGFRVLYQPRFDTDH